MKNKKPVFEWIDVKERVPDDDRMVLCLVGEIDKNGKPMFVFRRLGIYSNYFEIWEIAPEIIDFFIVVAWCDIPEISKKYLDLCEGYQDEN